MLDSLRDILLGRRAINRLDGELNEGELLNFISMVEAELESWNNGAIPR